MMYCKHYLYLLLLLLLFSPITSSRPEGPDTLCWDQSQSSSIAIPSQESGDGNSKILYPRIGNPAIVLNGSNFEIHIKGPANISSWNIGLYKEYLEYAITFDSPIRNVSTGVWHINSSIPSDSRFELFDLVITISDGISTSELVERNAIHVRDAYPTDLKLVHIADSHTWASNPDADTRLLSALYQASAARVDLVIITGDLVQYGDVRSFQRFYNLIAQSSVPVFVNPGNRDTNTDGRGFIDYISLLGDDYYTAYLGPDIFLTMANSHGGELNSTQIEWIERDLAASSAQTKILGVHYPLTNLLYYNETAALELIRVCRETEVDIVLSGHTHADQVEKVNDTLWITTTSIGAEPDSYGHERYGFRVIEFQDGTPTSWNWTLSQDWSQPWDSVALTRYPMKMRDFDEGAYLSITNNLTYSIDNQILDFLIQPISGDSHYIATGANVLSTVNGTDAFLIRMGFDLDPSESTTIRIYLNDSQAPSLLSVGYPESVLVGEEYEISVNLTNPSGRFLDVYLDVALDNESLGRHTMTSSDGIQWRVSLVHSASGEVEFRIGASGYSGLAVTSQKYTFECLASETSTPPPDMVLILLGSIGLVSVVVVVLYIVRLKKAP
ncbi:MAG: metallophosphoesterase [Candidatus Thorarchaeota archaeon]